MTCRSVYLVTQRSSSRILGTYTDSERANQVARQWADKIANEELNRTGILTDQGVQVTVISLDTDYFCTKDPSTDSWIEKGRCEPNLPSCVYISEWTTETWKYHQNHPDVSNRFIQRLHQIVEDIKGTPWFRPPKHYKFLLRRWKLRYEHEFDPANMEGTPQELQLTLALMSRRLQMLDNCLGKDTETILASPEYDTCIIEINDACEYLESWLNTKDST